MRIPRYWARAEEQTPPDYDGPRRITVWGWSHDSRIEAERHARERLTELLDRLRQGLGFPTAYAYGERPLREEILEEWIREQRADSSRAWVGKGPIPMR